LREGEGGDRFVILSGSHLCERLQTCGRFCILDGFRPSEFWRQEMSQVGRWTGQELHELSLIDSQKSMHFKTANRSRRCSLQFAGFESTELMTHSQYQMFAQHPHHSTGNSETDD
jgi:hypothetical protein